MTRPKPARCWPWSHQWTRWRLIDCVAVRPISGKVSEPFEMQHRECERCGLIQRRSAI